MGKVLIRLNWKLRLYIIRLLQLVGLYKSKKIFYVGSSQTLPPPLSNQEESYLLAKLEEGDKTVRGVLIERNLRLVVYIARKYDNTGIDIEDLVSIGTIGLIKAVNTFDVSKKIKLATYASRCIENEILMYLRKNNKKRSELSFDEPLNVDWDGNELKLSDVLGTEIELIYKYIEEEVDRELLLEAMESLNSRERKIMILRFGLRKNKQELTQKEVADVLGISQSYISRLEKRIITKLQKQIKKMK
ncbi:MAG: RNA polymerase sporulation sigma factor SigE [Bacillota bacterium]